MRCRSFLLDPGTLFTLASGLLLTPVTGAMLHELSSVPVIANSVRLIAYGPKI